MELLNSCETLASDLEQLNEKIMSIQARLTSASETNKESLWASEFNHMMQMAAVYEDLMEKLSELEALEEYKFVVNRMRKQARNLVKTEFIDV